MGSWLHQISADEARRRLQEARPARARQSISIDRAAGRVLATDLLAPENLPPVARAAMDGYALRSADLGEASATQPVALSIVAAVAAGDLPSASLEHRQAAAISTGAVLPAGADAVAMLEECQRLDSQVTIDHPIATGRHVIGRGEDVSAGAIVASAGRQLTARDLSLSAAVGIASVEVLTPWRIAIVSSGAELVPPSVPPRPGQIRDVNQGALCAAVASLGTEVIAGGIVADDRDAIAGRLRELAAAADIVIVTGGTSVGVADHTAAALASLGAQPLFHGIAVRPGRPTLAARLGETLVVGLPGVPVAAAIVFRVLLRPLLLAEGPPLTARIARDHASAVGREDYVRVTLSQRGAELWATAVTGSSSSLSALALADGVAIVPQDRAALSAGDLVDVLRF